MNTIDTNDPDYSGRAAPADDAISLLDLIAVIVKRKLLVVVMTAAVIIVTVVFLFATTRIPPGSRWNFLPNKFKPTVKILLQDTSPATSLSSILNQNGLGALTGLIGGSASSGAKGINFDLANALLGSKTIQDGVVERFGFVTRYKISKYPKTRARTLFEKALKVKYDNKSGILEIGYEDIDPIFATDVINDVADRLQSEFKRLTLDKVTSKRQYLEDSIAQAEKDGADKSSKLVAFGNKYGIYDVPAQGQAQAQQNVSIMSSLQGQLVTKQMELQLQRKYLPESDSRIVRLKDEIAQIEAMKAGGKDLAPGTVPLNRMAEITVQYQNFQRDLQIQQSVLSVLKQQYETAKIEEMDTSQSFQVFEKAEVPEVRSSPNRARMAVIAAFAGFFLAVLVAFIAEYFDRAKHDPAEAAKLTLIKLSLALRRKPRRE